MKKLQVIFTLVICTSYFGTVFGQQQMKKKRDRFPSYFGLTLAPIVPSNFIGSSASTFQDTSGTLTTTFTQKMGYTFGASVRIGITKTISIETGIYQVRRNFVASVAVPDSNLYGSQRIGFVSYDIPVNALFYVQLSEKWFMNAALGFSINQYPSDVKDSIVRQGNKNYFQLLGRRTERTHFSSNASFGFEWRTEKAGTFYLGMSGKIPFRPIMLGVGLMRRYGTNNELISIGRINGSYFSLDLRYYIPTSRLKGTQFKNGPIEQ